MRLRWRPYYDPGASQSGGTKIAPHDFLATCWAYGKRHEAPAGASRKGISPSNWQVDAAFEPEGVQFAHVHRGAGERPLGVDFFDAAYGEASMFFMMAKMCSTISLRSESSVFIAGLLCF